ncbi:MAG: T9SS type A sorting domain-containing protein [Saprospiraceae bacterium]|nr:T9SS type A sorting domain-containing protein [Saprospiraceae bacterium]
MNQLQILLFLQFAILVNFQNQCLAQGTVLIAPSDVVITHTFGFDINNLANVDDATFGRILKDSFNRQSIITQDLVCKGFCEPNVCTEYPGFNPANPAQSLAVNIACNYFKLYFDASQTDKKYVLNWGQDGYVEKAKNNVSLSLFDLRIKSQANFYHGPILRVYSVIDQNNKLLKDTQTIWVVDCNFVQVDTFDCQNEISIYLNDSCSTSVNAAMILSGWGYCFPLYKIELRDWITNQIIDRDAKLPGIQVNSRDKGRLIKFAVIDPMTGINCWGKALVIDTLAPVLICPPNLTISCSMDSRPFYTGIASMFENCGDVNFTYNDKIVFGGCTQGFDKIISRNWIATDNSGNKSECIQTITVDIMKTQDVKFPPNFDGMDWPVLKCDEQVDKNIDISQYILNTPSCVGGYLLDSAFWFAHATEPDIYPNRRLPRILGWNIIDVPGDINFGHPNPNSIYYSFHKQWTLNAPICWAGDQHIMLQGTGFPTGLECSNFTLNYKDIVVDLRLPGCDAGEIPCRKILREWVVIDWCTNIILEHDQVIHVFDQQGPSVLYPDTLKIKLSPFECDVRWEVEPPWVVDNCSNELHYKVEIAVGVVLGNEISGYVVTNLPQGMNTAYIVASDCCGNVTRKPVTLLCDDNLPPTAICVEKLNANIVGTNPPGKNFAKIFARDLDKGSHDSCAPIVFFKAIRIEQLQGKANGTIDMQEDANIICASANGDDDTLLIGNQIYFDDFVNFCCSDVGKKVIVVLRVFDRDPGIGPIPPSSMNTGGNLFNRFTDCITEVEILDRSVPTLVAPPNIVVSCAFQIDINKLSDPNDPTFGRVLTELSNRKKVSTLDKVCYSYCVPNVITGYPGYVSGAPPSNPPATNRACDYYRALFDSSDENRIYELVWGFDGYVLSSCEVNPTIQVDDLRKCGQGLIKRSIIAFGPNGVKVTATQSIWVVSCSQLNINQVVPCDIKDDIIWPGNCNGQAINIGACGNDVSPDNPLLGKPEFEKGVDQYCALLTIEHLDNYFANEPDACLKLIRKWVIIDWCIYEPSIDSIRGKWEYLQEIKINDLEKPTLSIIIGNQGPPNVNGLAAIDIVAEALDNCLPADEIIVEYQIDEFNDGTGKYSGGFDYKVGPLNRKDFIAGIIPTFTDNPRAYNSKNSFIASGTYPIGIHKINWIIEDACNNRDTISQLFEVQKTVDADNEIGFEELLILMPNPTQGNVLIKSNQKIDKVNLISCLGASYLSYVIENQYSLEIINIPSGVYYVEAFFKGKLIGRKKLVVI